MINIKNLNFSYDENNLILDNLYLNIKDGCVYSLLGLNGSGKTTLFKCLNGELPSNIDVKKFSEQMLYIHDEMKFYNYLSGLEFVKLILSFKNKEFDKRLYEKLVNDLRMNDKIKEYIDTYSLGMKHKLTLIVAFLLKYKYILMDEPFTSLDFLSSDTMIKVVKDYVKQNNTIIISTHMLDIAQEISDKILLLHKGKIKQYNNDFDNGKEIRKIIFKSEC